MKPIRSYTAAFLFALLALPCFAVSRELKITVPDRARPGSTVTAVVVASTDGGEGEQVGFLHAEYSVDGGETWIRFCYDQDVGGEVMRSVEIKVGPVSSQALVRARAAFRGGVEGDVDFRGVAINWDKSWGQWASPPAKISKIDIK